MRTWVHTIIIDCEIYLHNLGLQGFHHLCSIIICKKKCVCVDTGKWKL